MTRVFLKCMVQALTQMVDITISIQRQRDPMYAEDIVANMVEEPAVYIKQLISEKEEEIRKGCQFGLNEFTEFVTQICDYYNSVLIHPYVADYAHVIQFAVQRFLILSKGSSLHNTYPIGVYEVRDYFDRRIPMVSVYRERRVVIIISYQKRLAPRLYQIHRKSYLYIGDNIVYVFSVRDGEGHMFYNEFSINDIHYETLESKRHTYLLTKYYCITSNRHRQTMQDAYHQLLRHKEGDDISLRVYDGYIERPELTPLPKEDEKEEALESSIEDELESSIEDELESSIEDDLESCIED